MKCKECKYWQGKVTNGFGDCYRVIQCVCPEIFEMEDDNGVRHKVPFDPHDVKYFDNNQEFINRYKRLKKEPMPEGVRVIPIKKRDVRFTEDGVPIVRQVELLFFQTRGDYDCESH